jgi:hypothetical protein
MLYLRNKKNIAEATDTIIHKKLRIISPLHYANKKILIICSAQNLFEKISDIFRKGPKIPVIHFLRQSM